MNLIKSLFVILFASSCNAATAKLGPSKYTVTFQFNGTTSSCLGGIIEKNVIISAPGCFGNRSGEAFNFTSVKAVVGSLEVPVLGVILPKFPPSESKVLRDYALVFLKEELNFEENGLTALTLPISKISVKSWGRVRNSDGEKSRRYKIVDSKNCPNSTDVTFIAKSHLCVELPNPDDRCSNQLGTPLVLRRIDGKICVFGLNVGCYKDSAHEVFSRMYFALGKSGEYLRMHVYP